MRANPQMVVAQTQKGLGLTRKVRNAAVSAGKLMTVPRSIASSAATYGGGALLAPGFDNTSGAHVGKGPFVNLLARDMGSTPAGRAWAMCALHPCGRGEITSPFLGDLAGMPDTMTGSVVTPSYPGETYIKFDLSLFPTQPTTDVTGTWGIDIVVPPIPEIDYLYRIRYDAEDLVSYWKAVRLANFENPVVPSGEELTVRGTTFASIGYGRARCIAAGHTFELDASALTNQGRVVASQVSGQWTDITVATPRIVIDTATAVTGVGPPVTTGTFVQRVNALPAPYGPKVQILSVTTDPSELVAACPSSYQGLAKDGAYVVTKFQSPLLGYPFANTGDDGVVATDLPEVGPDPGRIAVFPQTSFAINSAGYGVAEPLISGTDLFAPVSAIGGGGPGIQTIPGATDTAVATYEDYTYHLHPFVSQRSDMQVAIVTFRNLSLNATSGSTSNVRVKSRNYFECIPQAQNPATTPFTHCPAPYDREALDAVIVVGKQLADGYPASYNNMSEILNVVRNVLGVAGKAGANALADMNIPIISGMTRLLTDHFVN
jgi:hypothetical protein